MGAEPCLANVARDPALLYLIWGGKGIKSKERNLWSCLVSLCCGGKGGLRNAQIHPVFFLMSLQARFLKISEIQSHSKVLCGLPKAPACFLRATGITKNPASRHPSALPERLSTHADKVGIAFSDTSLLTLKSSKDGSLNKQSQNHFSSWDLSQSVQTHPGMEPCGVTPCLRSFPLAFQWPYFALASWIPERSGCRMRHCLHVQK